MEDEALYRRQQATSRGHTVLETHHNHLSFEYESLYQYSVDATDKDAVLGKRHREDDETESHKPAEDIVIVAIRGGGNAVSPYPRLR